MTDKKTQRKMFNLEYRSQESVRRLGVPMSNGMAKDSTKEAGQVYLWHNVGKCEQNTLCNCDL